MTLLRTRLRRDDAPDARGPVVVVLGPYRSGTSCTAGVLHHLGLHLGRRLMRGDRRNARGYYEPVWLARRLRRLYDEPRLERLAPRERRIATLRRFVEAEGRVARRRDTLLCMKHALLCEGASDLAAVCGDRLRPIAVERPIEEALASLDRVGWWRPGLRRPLLERLLAAREAFLSGREALRVDYHALLRCPRREVLRIASWLELRPPRECVEAAVSFVSPALRHVARERARARPG